MVKDVKAKSQEKQSKNNTSNSELFRHVIKALNSIISRRTSENYSTMVINDIIKNMEDKFKFLKYVKVIKTGYSEDDSEVLDILKSLEYVDEKLLGKAI